MTEHSYLTAAALTGALLSAASRSGRVVAVTGGCEAMQRQPALRKRPMMATALTTMVMAMVMTMTTPMMTRRQKPLMRPMRPATTQPRPPQTIQLARKTAK